MSDVVDDSGMVAVLAPASTKRETQCWSELTRLSGGAFRVRLGGTFGQGWLASLCRGLAAQRISIERAHAMRTRNLSWIAEFTAVALEGAPDPESVPFLALAKAPVSPNGQPVVLDVYALEPCYDGTLKLSFEAADTLGLLGTLLEQLALLGLYPVEMGIDTQTARASDTLWLCNAEGATPSSDQRDALERTLKAATSLGRA